MLCARRFGNLTLTRWALVFLQGEFPQTRTDKLVLKCLKTFTDGGREAILTVCRYFVKNIVP